MNLFTNVFLLINAWFRLSLKFLLGPTFTLQMKLGWAALLLGIWDACLASLVVKPRLRVVWGACATSGMAKQQVTSKEDLQACHASVAPVWAFYLQSPAKLAGADFGVPVQVAWDREAGVSLRPGGITGYATAGAYAGRVHVCASQPCEAVWPSTKYGKLGPPRRFWLAGPADVPVGAEEEAPHSEPTLEIPVASEASAGSGEPQDTEIVSAGAGPGAERSEVSASLLEAHGSFPEASVVCESEEFEIAGFDLRSLWEAAPGTPTHPCESSCLTAPDEAPLLPVWPAYLGPAPNEAPLPVAGSALVAVDSNSIVALPPAALQAVLAMEGAASSAVEGPSLQAVLAMARSIVRPRAYVGWAAFLALALWQRAHVFVWEGLHRIDLVQSVAPWAVPLLSQTFVAHAVACRRTVDETSGEAFDWPISAANPVSNQPLCCCCAGWRGCPPSPGRLSGGQRQPGRVAVGRVPRPRLDSF